MSSAPSPAASPDKLVPTDREHAPAFGASAAVPARHAGFTVVQWRALAAFGVLVAVTWVAAPWPAEQALHHSLTVVALVGIALVQRRYALPLPSFLLLLAFLALHTVAARWLYSYVPYDEWTRAILGFRLSDGLGWQRNHFNRLVHLSYGLCLAPVLYRYFRAGRRWSAGWSAVIAVEIVLSSSAAYELFEWLIGIVLSPATAEAYNGQQGDVWDAHRDIALATLGAVLAVALVRWRECRTVSTDSCA